MMLDLDEFFYKKEVPHTIWTIKHGQKTYKIDSRVVIKHMLKTQGDERYKIAGTLLSIEFTGAQIVEYLQKYAKDMIAKIYPNVPNH